MTLPSGALPQTPILTSTAPILTRTSLSVVVARGPSPAWTQAHQRAFFSWPSIDASLRQTGPTFVVVVAYTLLHNAPSAVTRLDCVQKSPFEALDGEGQIVQHLGPAQQSCAIFVPWRLFAVAFIPL